MGDCDCEAPPGFECKGFKVLQEDDPDEEEVEEQVEFNIRKIEAETKGESKVKAKVDLKMNKWANMGMGEIVVDSAADESCWPKDLGGAFPTRPAKKIILKTANGGSMAHYGEKKITFKGKNDDEVVGLTFQVTDVKKPLLAVRRLVERGNVVSFGPEEKDNYIHHPTSGKTIPMEKKGGSFIIRAHFVKDLNEPVFAGQVR